MFSLLLGCSVVILCFPQFELDDSVYQKMVTVNICCLLCYIIQERSSPLGVDDHMIYLINSFSLKISNELMLLKMPHLIFSMVSTIIIDTLSSVDDLWQFS